jgi:hypothetical protein
MADRAEFDAFVAARSSGLLRTAYLLTRDWGNADVKLRKKTRLDLHVLASHLRSPLPATRAARS